AGRARALPPVLALDTRGGEARLLRRERALQRPGDGRRRRHPLPREPDDQPEPRAQLPLPRARGEVGLPPDARAARGSLPRDRRAARKLLPGVLRLVHARPEVPRALRERPAAGLLPRRAPLDHDGAHGGRVPSPPRAQPGGTLLLQPVAPLREPRLPARRHPPAREDDRGGGSERAPRRSARAARARRSGSLLSAPKHPRPATPSNRGEPARRRRPRALAHRPLPRSHREDRSLPAALLPHRALLRDV